MWLEDVTAESQHLILRRAVQFSSPPNVQQHMSWALLAEQSIQGFNALGICSDQYFGTAIEAFPASGGGAPRHGRGGVFGSMVKDGTDAGAPHDGALGSTSASQSSTQFRLPPSPLLELYTALQLLKMRRAGSLR